MYDNPKHIKKHPVKSRYDDFEREHLARAAEKAGEQVATFQRNATLQAIELLERLFNEPTSLDPMEKQFIERVIGKRVA